MSSKGLESVLKVVFRAYFYFKNIKLIFKQQYVLKENSLFLIKKVDF
jgi:hypothetical protein